MTDSQLLWKVEIPLALGVIFAGIRVATVIAVGVATIAAAVGAGGLGMFIFRGVSMVDTRVILAGAIPAAALALIADFGLGAVQKRFSKLLCLACMVVTLSSCSRSDRIVVGSKNFTEQVILGELLAQQIERSPVTPPILEAADADAASASGASWWLRGLAPHGAQGDSRARTPPRLRLRPRPLRPPRAPSASQRRLFRPLGSFATVKRGRAPPSRHRSSSAWPCRGPCCAGARVHASADARRHLLAPGAVHRARPR